MNDAMKAVVNPSTSTPGANGTTTRNVMTWKTMTRTAIRMRDRGATTARSTGRMMALTATIRITAMAASAMRAMLTPGMIQAVSTSEIVETRRVMTRRLISAQGPPRHSHRTRAWVV